MKKLFTLLLLLLLLAAPVSAAALQAPEVPEEGSAYMPIDPQSFGEGVWYVFKTAISKIRPELADAAKICLMLLATVLLGSVLQQFEGTPQRVVELGVTVALAVLLLQPTNTLIRLGVDTVAELSQYGKLLLPVMTAALAAQGGITASTALYTGTAFFNALLSGLDSNVVSPMLLIYGCLTVANSAVGENMLKNLRDFVKWLMTWSIKIILYVFTGYMGITGVVSGTADAAALKVTKLTISGMVPVVGGILSDASEAVLVGAGVVKSSVGIYGLLAVLSLWIGPFLQIGVQYLLLKVTAAACGVFGVKSASGFLRDFSAIMGFLLAMTGTVCLMLLISTVCFMKGVQ